MKNPIKTAIITGAASGIGRDVTIKLFDEGYKVILFDKNQNLLNALKDKLHKSGNDSKHPMNHRVANYFE